MFRKLSRLFKYHTLKAINDVAESKKDNKIEENIPVSIKDVELKLRAIFSDASDFEMRRVIVNQSQEVLIAFIDGLVNKDLVNHTILKPLMIESSRSLSNSQMGEKNILDSLNRNILYSSELGDFKDFKITVDHILSGDTVIYIDGVDTALIAGTRGWSSRSVSEPETEVVVRGPREGFTEVLRTNTSLLRRKIKNPKLKFETITIGEQTNTEICICYIKDLVNKDVLATVRRRLKRINTDAILESGYLEEFIEDDPWSPFPTVGNSEKPDNVAAKILEGRVAIFCDGTPFVLTVPYLFIEALQASEDYYSRSYFAMIVRFLRLLALFISTTLPALYVATINFHPNIIPFKLVLSMTASRQGIPFSPFTEALIMLAVFEILREAGVRMPKAVGQAVSIVGALVLGDAAAKANLASNPMLIVTALTAIGSFLVLPFTSSMIIIRLALLIAANILGFLGIFLVSILFLFHLCSLRSFGASYMAPFAPLSGMDLKDTLVKVPVWLMLTRPRALTYKDRERKKYRMNIDYRKKED